MQVFENSPGWGGARKCLEVLHKAGYLAYVAGGCVRDGLLGLTPADYDIATNATPDEVHRLFAETRPIGASFGVTLVLIEGCPLEVATFRGDGEYLDGRRPSEVRFSSPEEDAKRRDFTINGLFYDVSEAKVIDYVGGLEDLKTKTLRAIGEPRLRFAEDHLRILRLVRFSLQLGFCIEPESLLAAKALARRLELVSRERIFGELSKMISSTRNRQMFLLLQDIEIAKVIFKPWYEASAYRRSVELFSQISMLISGSSYLWASVFVGSSLSSEQALNWMRDYRFPKKSQLEISAIINVIDQLCTLSMENRWRHGLKLDQGLSPEIWPFARFCLEFLGRDTTVFDRLWGEYNDRIHPQTGHLDPPLLSGKDLQRVGFEPGARLGKALDQAYHYQIYWKINDKAVLVKRLLDGSLSREISEQG